MALYTVSSGSVINAQDVNQVVTVLQQNAGGQEAAKYFLAGNGASAGCVISLYILTRSRGTVPVSVSIDTSDLAPTGNLNAPTTSSLTANGFQLWASISGAATNARCAGNWTVQY